MRYFRIVVAAAAPAATVALTVLACFTGIYGLFIRSIRTVSCHRAIGCCALS